MEITVKLPVSDWLDLCALHEAVRAIQVKNIGNDPMSYSKISRITNEIEIQIAKSMADELTQLLLKYKPLR